MGTTKLNSDERLMNSLNKAGSCPLKSMFESMPCLRIMDKLEIAVSDHRLFSFGGSGRPVSHGDDITGRNQALTDVQGSDGCCHAGAGRFAERIS